MLRSVKHFFGYRLGAQDGKIGHCKDFLFDDEAWTIRYIVADTGNWLPDRKVLIPVIAVGEADWNELTFHVWLTKNQIQNAPGVDTNAPVSQQMEAAMHKHYKWPVYWGGTSLWGIYPTPELLYHAELEEDEPEPAAGEQHLRSIDEVLGYSIEAEDGTIGHVEDFIVNDHSWILRYLVVDTSNWLPFSKKVLVSAGWIENVSWTDRKVSVGLKIDRVKDSPEYNPNKPVNQEYEKRLYDFYGRPHYWDEGA